MRNTIFIGILLAVLIGIGHGVYQYRSRVIKTTLCDPLLFNTEFSMVKDLASFWSFIKEEDSDVYGLREKVSWTHQAPCFILSLSSTRIKNVEERWSRLSEFATRYFSSVKTAKKKALSQKGADVKQELDQLANMYENGKKYEVLKQTYDRLKGRYRQKHPKMKELQTQLQGVSADYQKRDIVAREIEDMKGEYSVFLKQYEHFLTSAPLSPSIEIKSLKAIAIGTFFFVGIGIVMLLGLFGAGWAIFSILDRRIWHPRHILRLQKEIPLLVVTPQLSRRQLEHALPVHQDAASLYSKSMILIRNRLLTLPSKPKIIVVSSMGQRKERVSLASNLAISLAQSDKKILLMDSHVRDPRQHRYFKLPNQGMAQLLEQQEVSPFNVEIPGLHILPAGEGLGMGSFMTDHFSQVLRAFRESYDFVFIDAPSFSLESESILLAQKTDGVILTIPRGEVLSDAFEWIQTELKRYRVSLLGVILKNAPPLNTESWNQFSSSRLFSEAKA